jgi:acetylornithine deacetylase/succinyl-diaminopimelate desuccinylase-like protein
MDHIVTHNAVARLWAESIVPSLSEFVAIPAVSGGFDPDWAANGHLHKAVAHLRSWISARKLTGAALSVVEVDGRSPLLVVDVPASDPSIDGTVLLYGHLDKQPPVADWADGLDAWTPVIRDGRLYGRGAADDGYAGYAAVAALQGVVTGGGQHARSVILLETGEESGSPDLPFYLEYLADTLGDVSLIICLDSGANDHERVWLTTSLRGLVQVDLTVKVLNVGQHSGMASGVVPSSFRIARELLDRLEDSRTGEILLPELSVDIPAHRLREIQESVAVAPGVFNALPKVDGLRLLSDDEVELTLNNTWRPTLSITGAAGLPLPLDAGNVLRSETTLSLSFRLPPTADSAAALAAVTTALTENVPYGAEVTLSRVEHASGFSAPDLAPWLDDALAKASTAVLGGTWRTIGLGGSIPFMGLLAESYPQAQFVITGALDLQSNAHVPDESLHLDYTTKLTEALSHVLHAHATR